MAETDTSTSRYAKSEAAYEKAGAMMPGGVNSPPRAFGSVGRAPIVIRKGAGCRLTDVDGNTYIDYVSSFGALIAGHAHPLVTTAVTKAAQRGTSFGLPSEAENRLAEAVVDAVPSIDLVRFVNSGTEATMSAIRLARGATGRGRIVKATGGYHGHADSLLVQAGSGATTLGVPSSPGVPEPITSQTLLAPFNGLETTRRLFEEHAGDVAGIIVEPVAGNMGTVPPADGYLQGLRDLCDQHGAVLIFDEVMTGFRVAYGGAQSYYNVTPDLTCLGKVVGGGMPCAAFGGKESLMRQIAPDGPIYQAGTLSGNPVAMAAGAATLELLREPGTYQQLEQTSKALADGLQDAARQAGAAVQLNRVGSMLTAFFTDTPVTDYETAKTSDTETFARFFRALLDAGVIIPPSQFEAWFPGLAHEQTDIETTLEAAQTAFEAAAQPG